MFFTLTPQRTKVRRSIILFMCATLSLAFFPATVFAAYHPSSNPSYPPVQSNRTDGSNR